MKTSILCTLISIVLSAVLSQPVKAQDCIRATVPFDFNVGKRSLPAGDYCVSRVAPDVLAIRNLHTGNGIMAVTIPADPSKAENPVLTFKHYYDDSYFLYRVADAGRGWQFHQSAAENDLLAKKSRSNPVSVAASLSHQ